MRIGKRFAGVFAFFALLAFYYCIPELEITDSRYVLATSDILAKTGGFDLRPLVVKGRPLVGNYHFLVRSTDLPPDALAAAIAAHVHPFGKSPTSDYYVVQEVADAVPGSAGGVAVAAYPILPRYPNWPSVLAAPVSLLTSALGVPVFDGVTFHEGRNALYQRIGAAALAALTVLFFYAAVRCVASPPWRWRWRDGLGPD
jgi:hypothetical protein